MTQDTNEPSGASGGSVAGEPVAWAALRDDGDIAWIGYTPDGAADGACGRRVIPLYRSPTLTEDEQEAILCALERAIQVWTDEERMDIPTVRFWIDTIRKLLARCAV